jgi:hypothetical protein
VTDSPLIGRSWELSRMRPLLDSGDGGALVVLGEAVIGKSALLANFAGYARAHGLRVLSAVSQERESSLAFGKLLQLLRPVLAELLARPGRHAEELPDGSPAVDSELLLTSAALLELPAGRPRARARLRPTNSSRVRRPRNS